MDDGGTEKRVYKTRRMGNPFGFISFEWFVVFFFPHHIYISVVLLLLLLMMTAGLLACLLSHCCELDDVALPYFALPRIVCCMRRDMMTC